MAPDEVKPGNAVPDDINVIVEIPRDGDTAEYEVDKSSGVLFVERLLTAAMHYPTSYGYLAPPRPGTAGQSAGPALATS